MEINFAPKTIHFLVDDSFNSIDEVIKPLTENGFVSATPIYTGKTSPLTTAFSTSDVLEQKGRGKSPMGVFLMANFSGGPIYFDDIYQLARRCTSESFLIALTAEEWEQTFEVLSAIDAKPLASQVERQFARHSYYASDLLSKFEAMLSEFKIPDLETLEKPDVLH